MSLDETIELAPSLARNALRRRRHEQAQTSHPERVTGGCWARPDWSPLRAPAHPSKCLRHSPSYPDGYLVEIEQPAGVGSTEPADSEGGGFAGAEAES
jgi:hypothetical protein